MLYNEFCNQISLNQNYNLDILRYCKNSLFNSKVHGPSFESSPLAEWVGVIANYSYFICNLVKKGLYIKHTINSLNPVRYRIIVINHITYLGFHVEEPFCHMHSYCTEQTKSLNGMFCYYSVCKDWTVKPFETTYGSNYLKLWNDQRYSNHEQSY